MSKTDLEVIQQEEDAINKNLKASGEETIPTVETEKIEKPAEKKIVSDLEDNISKIIQERVEAGIQKVILDKFSKPQQVLIKNIPEVKVQFPKILMVKGLMGILNKKLNVVIEKFPELQKIYGRVTADVTFPEMQKIEGVVTAKIDGSIDANVKFPDVQKISGPVATDIPMLDFGDQKVVPIVFWDGKRLVNPFQQTVQSSGRVVSVLERVIAGGLGGGSAATDGTAFTAGTTNGTPMEGVYESTPSTLTTGKMGVIGLDASRNQKVVEQYQPGFEDNTNNVAKVEAQYTATRITADAQIKASAGYVHAVTLSPTTATPTAGLFSLYNNTAESGTLIFTEWFFATDQAHTLLIDAIFSTGIYAGYDATLANVSATISWR